MVMITRATQSQAMAALPSDLGGPPWLPVLGLLLRGEVPYDTPPTQRVACVLLA